MVVLVDLGSDVDLGVDDVRAAAVVVVVVDEAVLLCVDDVDEAVLICVDVAWCVVSA